MIVEYYTSVVLVIIFSMVIMLTVIGSNKYLPREKKRGFITSFSLIIVVAFCECLSVYSEGIVFLREIHIFVKFLEFAVTPAIPVICAHNIFSDHKLNRLFLFVVLMVHTLLEFGSIFYGYIFEIDSNNIYHKSNFYIIYLIACALSVLYLFVSAKRFNYQYQNKNAAVLNMILIFMISGVSIQFYNSELRVDWLVISIASIFIYVHYNELVQYVDGLTQLLNQRSYLTYRTTVNSPAIVILFDVDSFKLVNDKNGHQYGNDCLIEISKAIKKCYGKSGTCYRIGGDEFCVILEKNLNQINVLNENFKAEIEKQRDLDQKMPLVSLGYAMFDPEYERDITKCVEEADQNMYASKKLGKEF